MLRGKFVAVYSSGAEDIKKTDKVVVSAQKVRMRPMRKAFSTWEYLNVLTRYREVVESPFLEMVEI